MSMPRKFSGAYDNIAIKINSIFTYLSIYLFVSLSLCLSICLSVSQSVSACLLLCLSVCLAIQDTTIGTKFAPSSSYYFHGCHRGRNFEALS